MSLEGRLSELESRMISIEARLGIGSHHRPTESLRDSPPSAEGWRPSSKPASSEPVERPAAQPGRKKGEEILSVTGVLGWGGAGALVLAAVYLIRLAIDSGWLTPERQIGISTLSGLVLIASGLWLRKSNRIYASVLPATGIVILFLSTYGAHLYYGLIGATTVVALVVSISLGSLWLCVVFGAELYALFAVVGSYSTPFLLPVLSGSITDLMIYFSAWSLVFCAYAVWIGKRRVYLVALYLALIGFDFVWRSTGSDQWIAAVLFHAAQFVIFGSGATYFSVRRGQPMDRKTALAHVPALLSFYFLEYSLLGQHTPALAPWIAAASGVALALFYLVARRFLQMSMEGANLLLGIYSTLVLLHAGYMESVPTRFGPWVALLLAPTIAGLSRRWTTSDFYRPVWIGCGIVFSWNYMRAVIGANLPGVPASEVLVVLFAVELYVGYYFVKRTRNLEELSIILLLAGHVSAMAAAAQVFDSRFAISIGWGLLALGCLAISLVNKDVVLGNSSLLVFAFSAGKVFLFDLSGAAPIVRIGCLVALGVSLYVGGLLYQKVNEGSAAPG